MYPPEVFRNSHSICKNESFKISLLVLWRGTQIDKPWDHELYFMHDDPIFTSDSSR